MLEINYLLILVVMVFAWNLVWGYSKGLLRVVYSMVAWLLILVFVTLATPYVSHFLTEYTGIDEKVETVCNEKLHELVHQGLSAKEPDVKKEDASSAMLPAIVLDKILDVNEAADDLLEESGVYERAARRAAEMAVKGITYLLMFVIVFGVVHVLAFSLDLISKLPLIGEVNHFLGLLAGALKGLLLVWLAFSLIAMAAATAPGTALVARIYEAAPLVWLYENNPILQIIMIFL